MAGTLYSGRGLGGGGGGTPALAATQIAFGGATGLMTSSAELTYTTATGVLDVAKSLSGGVATASVRNTSNTASSGSRLLMEVAGTSATGDAVAQWSIAGGVVFTAGIDVSTTNKDWVLSRGSALGTTNQISFSGNSSQVMFGGSGGSSTFTSGIRFLVRASANANPIFAGTENNNFLIGASGSSPLTDVASTVLQISAVKTIASAAGAVWDGVDVIAATATISGSTNITTATGFNLVALRAPTLSAASALAVTNSATLYIAGAPAGAGAGPATITNAYAVWVDSGLARFDGNGTRVFELPADATANITVATGRVPILVGGATKYFRYFDD